MAQEAWPDISLVLLETVWAPTVLAVLLLYTLYRVVLFRDWEACGVGCRAPNASLPDQIIYFSILRLANYRPETFRSVIHWQTTFLAWLILENWCKCRGLGPRVDALWFELRSNCSAGLVHVFLSTDRILLNLLLRRCTTRVRTVLQIFSCRSFFVESSYQRSLNLVGGDLSLWGRLLCCKYLVHCKLTEMFTIGMFAGFVVLRIIISSSRNNYP